MEMLMNLFLMTEPRTMSESGIPELGVGLGEVGGADVEDEVGACSCSALIPRLRQQDLNPLMKSGSVDSDRHSLTMKTFWQTGSAPFLTPSEPALTQRRTGSGSPLRPLVSCAIVPQIMVKIADFES